MALVPTKSSINHLNSHYYEETISYYGCVFCGYRN